MISSHARPAAGGRPSRPGKVRAGRRAAAALALERVVREQSTCYLPGYRPPRDVPDEETRFRAGREVPFRVR